MVEKSESQQFRDELFNEITEIPKDKRTNSLEEAKKMPEYWQARTEKIKKRQDEIEINDGFGVLLKKKTIYHGSGIRGIKRFNKAEEETVGSGIYFTSEAKDAIGYARIRSKRERNPDRRDGLPTIEDSVPIIYESSVENIKLLDLRKNENVIKVLEGFRKILEKNLQEELENPDLKYKWRGRTLRKAIETIDAGEVKAGNLREVTLSLGPTFSDYVKSLGYEGLIALEGGEEDIGEHDTYLIFDPDKIKINQEYNIL